MYRWQAPLSIVELLQRGTLDVPAAARLWLAVERGASLVVVATPLQGAGKTTVIEALLAFVSPERSVLPLRGMYEDFSFRDLVPPQAAYLYCNEISDHLYRYLWGHRVAVLFEAVAAGYPVGTTMHAASAQEALATLAALGVPQAHLTCLDFILLLQVMRRPTVAGRLSSQSRVFDRRIVEVAEIRRVGGEVRPVPVVRWQAEGNGFRQLDAWQRLEGGAIDTAAQVLQREAQLRAWLEADLSSYDAVAAAVRRRYLGAKKD